MSELRQKRADPTSLMAARALRVLVQHDDVCELRRLPNENRKILSMLKNRYLRAVLNLLDCAENDAQPGHAIVQEVNDDTISRFFHNNDDVNLVELGAISVSTKLAVTPCLCALGYNVIGNPGYLPEPFECDSLFLCVWGIDERDDLLDQDWPDKLSALRARAATSREARAEFCARGIFGQVRGLAHEQGRVAADEPVFYRAFSSPLSQTNVTSVKSALRVVLRHDDSSELRRLREENDRLKSMLTNRYLRSVLNLLAVATYNPDLDGTDRLQTVKDGGALSRYYNDEDDESEIELSQLPLSEKLAIIPSLCAFGYNVITGILLEGLGEYHFYVMWGTSPEYIQEHFWRVCELAEDRGDPLPVLHPASATPL